MNLFRYRDDILPVTIISLYFLADLLVYFNTSNVYLLAGWFFLGIFPKTNICVWNHHHHHCRTFRRPLLNRLLEIMYGFQTGMLATTWVLQHVNGHHSHYLDQERDASRWQANGKTISVWRYIAEGIFLTYPRAINEGRRKPKLLRRYLKELAVSLSLLIALTVYRPLPALFIFWLPMLASLIVTMRATYYHHLELSVTDSMAASRNVVDSKWLNILAGNIGFHTAHHHKCGLHWSKLPELHRELEPRIPKHCYTQTVPVYYWLDDVDRWLARTLRKREPQSHCETHCWIENNGLKD